MPLEIVDSAYVKCRSTVSLAKIEVFSDGAGLKESGLEIVNVGAG
jgi:hypothetical protein